ncbi:hypothetical protein RN001_015165 [Aquatica leii]|uniref:Nitroreductase domain-containing protein n=1 Tax=Aquatica leii TaxID=1421715 RepID=A0AAN7S6J1_9COLE|nr:hypothetical protein RN001_015165 [Aquatica leii]
MINDLYWFSCCSFLLVFLCCTVLFLLRLKTKTFHKLVKEEEKKLPKNDSIKRSQDFYQLMNTRRTVRHFSKESFPIDIIYNIIKAAGTSPSAAHAQPWKFVIVQSAEIKNRIREIVEEEEETNYKKRMGKKWVDDLKFSKTDWVKEYITDAPYLILVFRQVSAIGENGKEEVNCYSEQCVCIAAGRLLTAIHYAGLATLTSTPLNCGPPLRDLLQRPPEEKLTLLLPVGYPLEGCLVPRLKRKLLKDLFIEL